MKKFNGGESLFQIEFTRIIFVDVLLDSTTDQLKSVEKSIFEIELNLCQIIPFDGVVLWSDHAQICQEISSIEPNGTTDPSYIFQNLQTKQLFQQSDFIVFLTDGQIEH